MFLTKNTLLFVLATLYITGCATTEDNKKQQAEITNLQASLTFAKNDIEEIQAELDSTNNTLRMRESKITELTLALNELEKKLLDTESKIKKSKKKKAPHLNEKTVFGQSEWAYVSILKDNFKGRIDTGAAISSINAVGIEYFERDGEKWVHFDLTHARGKNPQMIEAKIQRFVTVKQSSNSENTSKRPVIKLHVRIGDIVHLTEFTLTSRLHMRYPVLIGRNFMRDVALVDVSQKYIFPKHHAKKHHKK